MNLNSVKEDLRKKSSCSEHLASLQSTELLCAHLSSGMEDTAQMREIKAAMTFYATLRYASVLLRELYMLYMCLPKMQKLKEKNIGY